MYYYYSDDNAFRTIIIGMGQAKSATNKVRVLNCWCIHTRGGRATTVCVCDADGWNGDGTPSTSTRKITQALEHFFLSLGPWRNKHGPVGIATAHSLFFFPFYDMNGPYSSTKGGDACNIYRVHFMRSCFYDVSRMETKMHSIFFYARRLKCTLADSFCSYTKIKMSIRKRERWRCQ